MTWLPSTTTVPDVLRWLGEDQDRVWQLLALWNDGCHLTQEEGLCEFIVGGLCTEPLAEAATVGAEVSWNG